LDLLVVRLSFLGRPSLDRESAKESIVTCNGKKMEKNVVEEWCFSNGNMGKMLLKSGVSTMGKWEKCC
jgi:hypothetical protein